MTADVDVDQVLAAAGDYMERVGKATGMYQDKDGQVCALGAIYHIQRLSMSLPEIEQGLVAAKLDRWLESEGLVRSVVQWSDNSDQETVVKGLRAASVWIEE